MCGIVGYLGKQDAYPVLIKGLKRLEYRGYDSAGVALINDDGALNVYKTKGKVADLENFCSDKNITGSVGIAHTRWATHGEPSSVNAHPHYSSSKNLAIIHNGIIENYAAIKKNLIAKGVTFRSDTDTEVLVQLIEYIQVKKNLEDMTTYDDSLANALKIVEEAYISLQEAAYEVRDYGESMEFSPEKLDKLQQRMDVIYRLRKKYGATIADVLAHQQKVQQELAAIENYDDDMAAMAKEIEALKGRLKIKAAELTRLRKRAALELSRSICEQLQALGMPKAVFRIDVTPADKYLPTGNDNVAMFFSANPGEQEKLLQKVASGGELSRIALAIKTVAASRDSSVPSMVFDEIDTGIGGRTAQMVAERIALVAAYKQVLCITHLPQIACMADIHLYIAKESAGENTITKIRPLTERERISEIARMASGADITTASLDNAKEMVSHARIKKQNFSKS